MIIFSDLHLTERTADVALEVLRRIPEVCDEHDDQHVAFLGDWWQVRHTLPIRLALAARDILEGWGVQRFDVLPGNHDQVDTAGRNALELFSGLPYETEVHTHPGWTGEGFWLPYRHTHEEVVAALQTAGKADDEPRVCFAHLGVRGALMNNLHADSTGVDDKLFRDARFRRVFLGHYHKHQQIRKGMFYVGSPYQTTYAEAGQPKGYVRWDGTTAVFHEWRIGPRHFKVVVDADRPSDFHLSGVEEGDKLWVLVKGQMAGTMSEVVSAQLEAAGVEAARIDVDLQPSAPSARLQCGAGETLDSLATRFVDLQDVDEAFRPTLHAGWTRLRTL